MMCGILRLVEGQQPIGTDSETARTTLTCHTGQFIVAEVEETIVDHDEVVSGTVHFGKFNNKRTWHIATLLSAGLPIPILDHLLFSEATPTSRAHQPLTEKRYTIETVEPLLLFGLNDAYLRKIESAFPETRITARGNELLLKGSDHQLRLIERIMEELTLAIGRNGNLTENDVDTVLALFTTNGERGPATLGEHVVLYKPDGGTVKARTPNQIALVESARSHDIVFAIGPAGTGKTYTAVALAVSALKSRQVRRIVLCRPAVEAGERLGFLPGDYRDKVDPYLRPLYDALEDMIPREKLTQYMEQNVVEIAPIAYMRGRTLHSSFVILDEAQNATTQQMKMFLTRLGTSSRSIVTGDITQIDLASRFDSGLIQARSILPEVDGISFVYFDTRDVVRHKLVKDIIAAYEKMESDKTAGDPST
jgi:phosphate starvation-inducible PhoH-like protein